MLNNTEFNICSHSITRKCCNNYNDAQILFVIAACTMCNCKKYVYNTLTVVRECFNNICLRGNTRRLKIRWFDVLNERRTKRS